MRKPPHWLYPATLALVACQPVSGQSAPSTAATDPVAVADTSSDARAPDGRYISWREHLIDDERTNGGVPIRGGDGLALGDIDRDGLPDIVSVHEDSNHLRIAFGTDSADAWQLVTVGEGEEVAAIEDVAIGDLNGDGWPDLVAACEEAHLAYFQNPAEGARRGEWPSLIPDITEGRGSWLRVFIADINEDGSMDVLAANKGSPDIIDPSSPVSEGLPTSLFTVEGDPLKQDSWKEQVLSREVVPNTAMPVDIDNDGDLDVLAAARIEQTMTLLEMVEPRGEEGVRVQPHPIRIEAGFSVPDGWSGRSSAFQSAFADLDGDDRKDLVVSVSETSGAGNEPVFGGLGWLHQPGTLDEPWIYHRIGETLPDIIAGIALADIDGDGDLDAVTGGYSGLNILAGSYSGASRDRDDPRVTPASTVGRIAWFENPGEPTGAWARHDISRRVRGMYDGFIPRDLDGDGDMDLIATRGNSGEFDGVFWLEQVRTDEPMAVFTAARSDESRPLPLPPENWLELYGEEVTYVAPNKVEED